MLACGAPVPVSNAQTACDSIPGGVAVSPAGSAHPGRVYAVWSTADPQTNAASGVAGWTDQRLDPTGGADAASASAQSEQEQYDEIFATCQVSGSSLFAHPPGPPTCGR